MNDLRDYLDTCLGKTEGWLTGAIGVGGYFDANGKYTHKEWVPRFYAWPTDAKQAERELLCEAHLSDVYVCPYVMRYAKRAKGDAVARQLVHADVDNGRLDVDKVRAVNGFAVSSGSPGNGHAYVALTESVPLHHHEVLCRGLGKFLGAADSKIVDNDVLRPPGTFNHKPAATGGEPAPVEWLVRP
jgi:putative DNA primase/helicase